MKRIIFHVDMDAFFASIEQRENLQYRGKPLIVGAKPGNRGVVSTASYEARKFGIHSAMPINEAYSRCPQAIFITPRMEVYEKVSEAIMEIFEQFSPQVERVSVDEAFIDMTGTEKLFGQPLLAAGLISGRIRQQQGLTASIGIAPNKFVAKIATEINKPNGITCAPFDDDELIQWLSPLPVRRMWGVGRRSEEIFNRCSVSTIGDMQKLSLDYLYDRFGKQGVSFYYLCRGIDHRPVINENSVKSISREHTFNVDSFDKQEWKKVLHALAQDVARQARYHGVKASTIFLTYRRPDFSRHTRRQSIAEPTSLARTIYEISTEILDSLDERCFRLIGVGITGLNQQFQTDLFHSLQATETLEASEMAVDKINARFGAGVIKKGLEIAQENSKKKNIGRMRK
ncbi:MAG TPA: DNA polymerase IV [Chitinispirillaceae bacterium]|nr:DNA polymerase IV [Chitinispirillaceae bacterium]